MMVIGQPPPAVLGGLSSTRASRNQQRYLQFLNRHPGAAAALQEDLVELGLVAFDLRAAALWDEAQIEVWH
jgi:hypothetical protein